MIDEPLLIKDAFERIESRSGSKKARIAGARRMFRTIYYIAQEEAMGLNTICCIQRS